MSKNSLPGPIFSSKCLYFYLLYLNLYIPLFIIIIANFCIRCNIKSIPFFWGGCLWISNYPSTICWKDYTFSIKIFLYLCQKSVGRTCLVLYPILLVYGSIPLPALHCLGYCVCARSLSRVQLFATHGL